MESDRLENTQVKESNGETTKELTTRLGEFHISDSDEELDEIQCDLCKTSFTSMINYEQHLNGKKHSLKVIDYKKKEKFIKENTLKKKKHEVAKEVEGSPPNATSADEESHCDVCDKTIVGFTSFLAHLRGRDHAKILRQKGLAEKIKGTKEFVENGTVDVQGDEDGISPMPFGKCGPCEKTFNGPEAYQQHMDGVNHKKKLRSLKIANGLRNDENSENRIEGDDDRGYDKCDICNKSFSGPVPYKMHLKSLVHQKELKKIETEKKLSEFFVKDAISNHYKCKECQKSFTDILSFQSHLASNSHSKQKVKDELFSFVSSNKAIAVVKSVQNVSSDEETEETDHFQNGRYFLVCKLCNVSFSGPESAQDHLKSKNHMQVRREKAERKSYKKIKAQLSGSPSADRKNNDSSEGKSKMSTSNGDTNGSISCTVNAEDFEILDI